MTVLSKPTFNHLNDKKEVTDLSQIKAGSYLPNYDRLLMQMMADNGIEVVPIDIDNQQSSPEQREAHLTQKVTRLLDSNPESKVAVFPGLLHARRGVSVKDGDTILSLAQRITEAHYSTVTIGFGCRPGKGQGLIGRVSYKDYVGVDYKISLPPLTSDDELRARRKAYLKSWIYEYLNGAFRE